MVLGTFIAQFLRLIHLWYIFKLKLMLKSIPLLILCTSLDFLVKMLLILVTQLVLRLLVVKWILKSSFLDKFRLIATSLSTLPSLTPLMDSLTHPRQVTGPHLLLLILSSLYWVMSSALLPEVQIHRSLHLTISTWHSTGFTIHFYHQGILLICFRFLMLLHRCQFRERPRPCLSMRVIVMTLSQVNLFQLSGAKLVLLEPRTMYLDHLGRWQLLIASMRQSSRENRLMRLLSVLVLPNVSMRMFQLCLRREIKLKRYLHSFVWRLMLKFASFHARMRFSWRIWRDFHQPYL